MSISIPYGSIKRMDNSAGVHLSNISIPYGSIKSSKYTKINPSDLAFQFLMVRLKEKGTSYTKGKLLFQFLMVRLKVD